MTEAALIFDLVTPEKQMMSVEAEMVVVPGKEGDMGVLVGHSPVITSLRPGVIRVMNGEKVKERVLVTSGFAEITNERCTILATEAYDMCEKNLCKEQVEARRKAAIKVHEKAVEEHEKIAALSDLEIAESAWDALITELDSNH